MARASSLRPPRPYNAALRHQPGAGRCLRSACAIGLQAGLLEHFELSFENGIGGYLHHMAGSPRSGLEWGFVVLLFPLHLLGEFIKPILLDEFLVAGPVENRGLRLGERHAGIPL